MMHEQMISLLVFAIAMTFSPGANNTLMASQVCRSGCDAASRSDSASSSA